MVDNQEESRMDIEIIENSNSSLNGADTSIWCELAVKVRNRVLHFSKGQSRSTTNEFGQETSMQNSEVVTSNEQAQIVPKCEVSQLRDDARKLRQMFRESIIPPQGRLAEHLLEGVEELEDRARHTLYPEPEGWYAKGWWTLKKDKLRTANEYLDQDAVRALYSWLFYCIKTATAIIDARAENRQAEQDSKLMNHEDWEPLAWEECGLAPWQMVEREELLTKTRNVFPVRDPPM